jgi:mannose-1-phosphate guanylyltransferase
MMPMGQPENDIKIAIFSGGAGSRLWPVSRLELPKQFQPLTGSESLFQQIVRILERGFGLQNLFVVTGRHYVEAIRQQVPDLSPDNIIAEPEMRDTLAAVGYAAAVIEHRFPGARLATLWGADHIIRDEETFIRAMKAAQQLAAERDTIVKVDVWPAAPSTQLGYVQIGHRVAEIDGFDAYEFVRFTEKPDLRTARQYVERRQHLWNTGYFVWSSARVLDLYRTYAPGAYASLERIMSALDTSDEERVTEEQYATIPRTSVDYGVFSHIERGEMLAIPADLGWADVGAWDVLYEELREGRGDNVVLAEHIGLDTRGSLIYSAGSRLIATIGLDSLIIVDTPDAILVAPIDRAQDVKKVVEHLKSEGKNKYL